MSATRQLIARYDELWQLSTHLPGSHFADSPACADDDIDPELFFPAGPGAIAQARAAKQVCASCPVLAACQAFALHNQTHGIWGGMTEAERDRFRRGPNSNSGEVAA